ncbi:MAG: ABC transporter substrate-binding protein [Bacillota bacterium]
MFKNKTKIIVLILFTLTLTLGLTTEMKAKDRTVVDMMGREVKVPEKVERVITTYTPATQFVMALGADDRLVSGASGLPNQTIFTKINPKIDELPNVGSKNKGVNIESIMELNPDLVIMFPHGDGIETAARLKELGIATLVINPESFSQIRETNKLLGKALNLEEKAEKVDEQYQKILEISERTKDIPESERKKVYFANSELLDTVGENILQTDLIEKAGAINPAKNTKEGFIKASSEELIKWNPDQIIVSQFYRKSLDKLKNEEKYKSISAFKNDKIHRVPSNLEPWDYPSPSSALIIPWLAKKIYPEKFADLSLEKIVNDFYKELYGKTFIEYDGELN